MSFVMPGLGHMYVGMPRAAFLFGIAAIWASPIWVLAWAKAQFSGALFLWGFVLIPLLLRFFAAMAAAFAARSLQPRALRRWQSPLGYATFFLLFFMTTTLADRFVGTNVAMPLAAPSNGGSPEVKEGDGIWLVRIGKSSKPRKGALVVFRRVAREQTSAVFVQSEVPVLGRVLAVGGDEVAVTPDAVIVNGAPVPNSTGGKIADSAVLRDGQVFVLSATVSERAPDSRQLGPLPIGDYAGEVALVQSSSGPPMRTMSSVKNTLLP